MALVVYSVFHFLYSHEMEANQKVRPKVFLMDSDEEEQIWQSEGRIIANESGNQFDENHNQLC